MKVISVHVEEASYLKLQMEARRTGRPVASLIREAMLDYGGRRESAGHSVLSLRPLDAGKLRKRWTRSDLLAEMISR